jgi:hypothetical protein
MNINNIFGVGCVEVIDFSSCSECNVVNVIGHSQLSDENEAIDLGGCTHINISNVTTYGFGEGIKLKEEGAGIVTSDINISNCVFKDFGVCGIEIKTNYSISNYVVKNICINNCQFISSNKTARGIYNIRNSNNYGMYGIIIDGCYFKCNNYAIDFSVFDYVTVTNNIIDDFGEYSCLLFTSYDNALDTTKNGNVKICNNTVISRQGASQNAVGIDLINVSDAEIKWNKLVGNNRTIAIRCTNCKGLSIKNNEVSNWTTGISCTKNDVTKLKAIEQLIVDGNLFRNNQNVFILEYNFPVQQSTTRGFMFMNNKVYNDTVMQKGFVFSATNIDFDNVYIVWNVMYNVRYRMDSNLVLGANSKTNDNYSYYES